jgi:hypothetical protein
MRRTFAALPAALAAAAIGASAAGAGSPSPNAGCFAAAISTQAQAYGSLWGEFISSTAQAVGGVGSIVAPEASTKVCEG